MKTWWRGVRLSWRLRRELDERAALRERPWEEILLHWAEDGTLHGRFAPPDDHRHRSTTASGWCPGLAPTPHPRVR